jgi:hypothetical protein
MLPGTLVRYREPNMNTNTTATRWVLNGRTPRRKCPAAPARREPDASQKTRCRARAKKNTALLVNGDPLICSRAARWLACWAHEAARNEQLRGCRPARIYCPEASTKPNRPYRVECTGFRSAFGVMRPGARLVPGWGDRPGSPQGVFDGCGPTCPAFASAPGSFWPRARKNAHRGARAHDRGGRALC